MSVLMSVATVSLAGLCLMVRWALMEEDLVDKGVGLDESLASQNRTV